MVCPACHQIFKTLELAQAHLRTCMLFNNECDDCQASLTIETLQGHTKDACIDSLKQRVLKLSNDFRVSENRALSAEKELQLTLNRVLIVEAKAKELENDLDLLTANQNRRRKKISEEMPLISKFAEIIARKKWVQEKDRFDLEMKSRHQWGDVYIETRDCIGNEKTLEETKLD
jgi:hypothetical protein